MKEEKDATDEEIFQMLTPGEQAELLKTGQATHEFPIAPGDWIVSVGE